jgi:uncharacterized protein (TIGR03086 family)
MADPIVIERLLDTNPEETFALLTEPERLRRWQAISASIDLRVGGDYRFTVMPGAVAVGSVVELDPGRRLVMTWGWADSDDVPPGSSTLLVELEPEGEQTRVRFTHEGLVGEWAERHHEGWAYHLDRLVELAAGAEPEHRSWDPEPDALDHLSVAEATWDVCRQQLLTATPDDQELPTPCAEFNLHELVVHLRNSLAVLAGTAGGELDESIESTSAEDYVAVAAEAALAAWRSRGLDGEVPFGQGTAPAAVPLGIVSLECLVHAWDIAQAKGNETIDVAEPVAAYVLDIAKGIITDGARGSGNFDAAQDAWGDDSLTQLIAFTGRRPLP